MTQRSTLRFRVGLLGEGIGQSLTPAMHVMEGRRLGLDYSYELFDIAGETLDDQGLESFVRGLAAAGFAGLNVTHPYKQRVLSFIDGLSRDARSIGAANLLVFGDDGVTGHNTDWTGFSSSFMSRLRHAPRRSVLQLGSGGAGAATAYALLRLGVESLVISDLDPMRARNLVDRYAPMFLGQTIRMASGDLDGEWSEFDGVVHATPTGMAMHPGLPLEPSRLSPQAWIAEIVYRPVETELVRAGRSSGRDVIDGSMMAVGQAIDSLRILTGMEPDQARVRADLLALLEAEEAAATE
ncbi:shikimate dehydrogenase [Aeromicrobium endophyticum]|uniref:Shikimate dehydrogenase n=1 Tax=Aeromicrobium endophyticum TaxID=2292704 RepID=A0A371P611_9ACTN|nr:shikimate dehydrogenase [Aeromicrobium endophyticum]REK70926.1 shikimate dehydrogenase [Aeromicrobium endophyticum]